MVHVPADVAGAGEGKTIVSGRLWVMRVLQPFIGRIPGPFYLIAPWVGWLAFKLRVRMRRRMVRNMLPLVGGEQRAAEAAALAACQNIARYFVDLCTIPERMMERFEADHLELVHGERLSVLREPGPVIAMSAHSGNAELAIQALTFRGRPFVALVESQRPRAWSKYLLKLRSSAGGRFYETSFHGIRICLETLQEGGLVGFMGDRDIQGNGMCVELCGRHVRLPRGPWEIARRSRALVMPMFTARVDGDRFRLFVEEPFRVAQSEDEEADILAAVTRFAGLLETHLRRDPGQWAFTEDFWRVHACG